MDAVAYPDAAVSDFITRNFIPIRIQASDAELGPRFRIKWTPSLLILDKQGLEHNRTLGFFYPQELIPSLLLGIGKVFFDQPDRPKAISYFKQITMAYPESFQAPEAVYLKGVSQYIEDHDVANLFDIYECLKSRYPDSEWLMRADPYRLLKK